MSTCVDAAGNPVTSSLNVWIQSGSYVLIAFSEILASITGLEYAFTKAPKNMKSLVMALFLFTSAVSSAIGEAFNREQCIRSTGLVLFTDLFANSSPVHRSTVSMELRCHGRVVWGWWNSFLVLFPSPG